MILNVIVFFLRVWENLQLYFFLFSEKKFIKKKGGKNFFCESVRKKGQHENQCFWWVIQMIHQDSEKCQLDVFPWFLVVSKTKNGKRTFFFYLIIQKIPLTQVWLFHCLPYSFKRWKKKLFQSDQNNTRAWELLSRRCSMNFNFGKKNDEMVFFFGLIIPRLFPDNVLSFLFWLSPLSIT